MVENRDRLAGNSNEELDTDDDVEAHMRTVDRLASNTNESSEAEED